jgi:chromate reductase
VTTAPFRILALSGSLRARSINAELLIAAAQLGAPRFECSFFLDIAALPHFNPDMDGEGAVAPVSVAKLRSAVANTDALLISSPEYAHGVPGAFKNALDWLVSGPEMVNLPVGLLNASAHSRFTHAALAETLRTMSAQVVEGADVVVPINGRRFNAEAILADPDLKSTIQGALDALAAVIICRERVIA